MYLLIWSTFRLTRIPVNSRFNYPHPNELFIYKKTLIKILPITPMAINFNIRLSKPIFFLPPVTSFSFG